MAISVPTEYWALDVADVARRLETTSDGLSRAEAARRLSAFGSNELQPGRQLSRLAVLARQLRSPLLLLLVFAAGASALTAEWLDAAIVVTIVIVTVGAGYSREYSAQAAASALRAHLRPRCSVWRDRRAEAIPTAEVVPGDVIILSAGSLVPADALLLESGFLCERSRADRDGHADLRVRDAVMRQLEWDPEVNASAIGVAAKSGTVTLTGFVDSHSGKLAAERAANLVQGVRAVANDIDVRLRLERTDADIAEDTARALELRGTMLPNVQSWTKQMMSAEPAAIALWPRAT